MCKSHDNCCHCCTCVYTCVYCYIVCKLWSTPFPPPHYLTTSLYLLFPLHTPYLPPCTSPPSSHTLPPSLYFPSLFTHHTTTLPVLPLPLHTPYLPPRTSPPSSHTLPPSLYTSPPSSQCFTSIVGPNGSGKSNVIDAMLFVFGYRARKIRSKKISVLIHNSDQHKNLESCTVAVHFQLIIDLVCLELGRGEGE